MSRKKEVKKTKPWLLPLIAGVMAVLALVIVLCLPKNTGNGSSNASAGKSSMAKESSTAPGGESRPEEPQKDAAAEINAEGKMVIYADRLSSEEVSFIRVSESSRIELLSRLGGDGKVKAALGTCQSCNGSPGAYYTQVGSELKCNNCGLTFPVSVLDSPGGGCHPIMINEELVQYDGNNLVIDLEGLSAYEPLFSRVADH